MNRNYNKVRDYILDLGYSITKEHEDDGMLVIDQESDGIISMAICCTETVLVMEQFIFQISQGSQDIYMELLQKNRDILHGAFVLDTSGTKIIFRDTLQMENLDRNELEGSINSLSLLLSEYSNKILEFSKQ